MPLTTTTEMSNSVKQAYLTEYVVGAQRGKVYDQLSHPVGADMKMLGAGTAVNIPFIARLARSEQTISQTQDIPTTQLKDATVQLTPTSVANAINWPELLDIQKYTDYTARAFEEVGKNMMESVDWLAAKAALNGAFNKSFTGRSSLDAGTTTHRITRNNFVNASIFLSDLGVPSLPTVRGERHIAVFNPWIMGDLMNDTNILAVGQYQEKGIILNWEVGEVNGFALVVTNDAKLFLAAGAANATAIGTTMANDTESLVTTFDVASGTSIAAGMWLLIGAKETGSTFYTTNERVFVVSVATNTLVIIGGGENGGLKYNHKAGETVSNSDTVTPVVFGGPMSMGKVFAAETSEYGTIVGPKKDGVLDQFNILGYKYYGGYGIVSGNQIFRSEFSSSMDA